MAVSVTVEIPPLASGLSVNVTVNVSPTVALMFELTNVLFELTPIVPRNDPVLAPVSVNRNVVPDESVVDLILTFTRFTVDPDVSDSGSDNETTAFSPNATEAVVKAKTASKFFVTMTILLLLLFVEFSNCPTTLPTFGIELYSTPTDSSMGSEEDAISLASNVNKNKTTIQQKKLGMLWPRARCNVPLLKGIFLIYLPPFFKMER
jgi:hypothetical protein